MEKAIQPPDKKKRPVNNHLPENEYTDLLLDRGMAHIIYSVSGVRDVLHPYSAKDYPLLADEFIGFLEAHRPLIPKKAPIVLEITGAALNEQERELIDETIWTHCCLNMTKAENAAKSCLRRSILCLLFTLLSAVLILLAGDASSEILASFAYLPFWFFGYRLLIYLVIDCVPTVEDRSWYRHLASLKLIIPKDGRSVFENLDPESVAEELEKYEAMADRVTFNNKLVNEYLMENGVAALACRVGEIHDLVPIPELKGRELLSDGMTAYIDQAIPFINPGAKVTLTVEGVSFSPEEQQSIRRAVHNRFFLRYAEENNNSLTNKRKIRSFLISVLFSVLILALWGARISAAGHEFMLVLFWFFSDYALEFILISRGELNRSKRIWKALMKMDVLFEQDQAEEP